MGKKRAGQPGYVLKKAKDGKGYWAKENTTPKVTKANLVQKAKPVESLNEIDRNVVDDWVARQVPDSPSVRFTRNGQALDINNGELASKGSNVIYHPHYYSMPEDVAQEIGEALGIKVYIGGKLKYS